VNGHFSEVSKIQELLSIKLAPSLNFQDKFLNGVNRADSPARKGVAHTGK
jgi:hypothetical protein